MKGLWVSECWLCAKYRDAFIGLESEQHDSSDGREVRSEAVGADCGYSRVQTVPEGGDQRESLSKDYRI